MAYLILHCIVYLNLTVLLHKSENLSRLRDVYYDTYAMVTSLFIEITYYLKLEPLKRENY